MSLYHNRKQLLFYALPIMVSMATIAFCNIIDRIYIGESAGSVAVAGLALTLPFTVLISSVGALPGVGAAIRIAGLLKQNNIDEARKILGNTLVVTLLVTILTWIVCFGLMNELITAFGGRADTIPYARQYLIYFIPGVIFVNFTLNFANCMRVSGYSRKSSQILITGILSNIILNPLFIYVFGLGIGGSSLATIASMLICSLPILRHFTNKQNDIRFQWQYLRPDYRTIYKIISGGMPPFFMNMTICTVSIIMNNYLVYYGGNTAIGAYGIISSYSIIIMMILSGFSQGMQFIIRTNKDTGSIRQALLFTLRISTAITCIGFITGELYAEYMSMAFTANQTLDAMTQTGLRITFCTLPILGFQFVTANYFQSICKAKRALFMNLSRQFIFLIPSLFVFTQLWGMRGIWWAIPFSDLMATSVSLVFLWMEKQRRIESAPLGNKVQSLQINDYSEHTR